jgi:hypothetical protein
LLQNKSTLSNKIKQRSTFTTWRHLKAHMNTDTNLPDVYWRFAHSRADASQLGLRLGNGLPQLSPAPGSHGRPSAGRPRGTPARAPAASCPWRRQVPRPRSISPEATEKKTHTHTHQLIASAVRVRATKKKSVESGGATYNELEEEGVARRRHLLELVLHGATHREMRATTAAFKSDHRSNISAAETQNTPATPRARQLPPRGAGRRGLLRT